MVDSSATESRTAECRECGSQKMIPNVTIGDQGQYSNGYLSVVIQGKPTALLFKDRKLAAMTADICGDCGHAHLYVANPGDLYRHYQKSLKSLGQASEG